MRDYERYYNIKSRVDSVEEELEDLREQYNAMDDEAEAEAEYGEWIKELEDELNYLTGELAYI